MNLMWNTIVILFPKCSIRPCHPHYQPIEWGADMSRKWRYYRGLLGEIWAAARLTLIGYHPIKWRYQTPVGEIDLIMAHKHTIIFIEVKYRHELDTAVQSIPIKNRRRIVRASQWYLNETGDDRQPRIDMVAVNRWGQIRHIQNAWDPDGY